MKTTAIVALVLGFALGAGLFLATVTASPANGMSGAGMGNMQGGGMMGQGMMQGMGHGMMNQHQGDMGMHGSCHCCADGQTD